MTDSQRAAMRLALEALELLKHATERHLYTDEKRQLGITIDDLRAALAEAEPTPEQLAAKGWQAIECPVCGAVAQAFPKPKVPQAEEIARLKDLLGKAHALNRIRAERIKELEAQAGAEPVLFIHPDTFARAAAHVGAWKPGHELPGYIPLYTHPPAPRVALSDARWQYINDRAVQMSTSKYEALCSLLHIEVDGVTFDLGAAVDEAIEAAHGITGETK